jgi:hypothetical protein
VSTTAIETLPIALMPGEYSAESRCAARLASPKFLLSEVKISLLRFSRRNACTARMPPSDSTKCTITSEMASRVRR